MKSRSPRRPHDRKKATSPINPIRILNIEDMTNEGNGLARESGKVTFVEGALTGESVEARITKENSKLNQAVTTKILTASSQRQIPECQHFSQCGGCQLQHLSIDGQRDLKVEWLKNQLRHIEIPSYISMLSTQEFSYRRRARLAVLAKKGDVFIGFRKKSSKGIVDVKMCPVLVPALQEVYQALRIELLKTPLTAKIGHIELLEDAQGASVVLRLARSANQAEKTLLDHWAQSQGVALYWQQPDEERVVCDASHFYSVDNTQINFHPQDFIQVNETINLSMVSQAVDWLELTADDVVLDLFCGAGNFSLPLAKRAGRVLAIEAVESMVDKGRLNAEQANLSNVEFIAADLTQSPPNKIKKANVSKVLLDPPRAGALEFLPTLVTLNPDYILYVSCNAATLARDVAYLVEKGFRVTKVCMMDMFPQTTHIETMMLLQKV